MSWLQLTVDVDQAHLDLLEEVMQAHGALAVSSSTAATQAPKQLDSPLVCLEVLFPRDFDLQVVLRRVVLADPYFQQLDFQATVLKDEDWVRSNQTTFEPILINDHFWVCPVDEQIKDDRPIIRVNPGSAFGTGRHESTQLCLRWLSTHSVDGQVLVDYGCGSGVLSLAAVALGARKVYALDHLADAIEATRANAILNGIELDRVLVPGMGDATQSLQASVVLANMLAGALCALVQRFHLLLLPAGTLVLSGFQEADVDRIRQHFGPLFNEKELVYQGEWGRMVLQKK